MHHLHYWEEILLHPAISPFSSLQARQCLSWAGFAVARLSSEPIQIPKAAVTCASEKKLTGFCRLYSWIGWEKGLTSNKAGMKEGVGSRSQEKEQVLPFWQW